VCVHSREIDELANENISRTIIFYTDQTLRAIALWYRDFEYWPPSSSSKDGSGDTPCEDLTQELALIGSPGVEDPFCKGIHEAVARFHLAGGAVKMCAGDNVPTARSIAPQCGIFT